MVYGITIRQADMKLQLLLNNSEQTVSVAQGRKQMQQWDICKNGFLQNGRHNSYQTYWYDSSTCE